MELYGRPTVARRNTTPNVLFLNEPKPRPSVSAFAPPTARSQEKAAAGLHVAGERAAVASNATESVASASNATLLHLSRPPPSTRTIERPQSGGVRRPAPGTVPPTSTQLKQRPSTARESSRTGRVPSSSSNESETLFMSRWVSPPTEKDRGPEEAEPEERPFENRPQQPTPGASHATRDEEYIRQLKADILHCHQLLASERGSPASSSSSSSSASGVVRSHTHVKNVQNMRENRATESSVETVNAQLSRYNYSSDATQLQSAKAKLEAILGEYVTQLMRHFLELREELIYGEEDGDTESRDSERQQHPLDAAFIGLKRPPGPALSFANGCGTDAASMYAGSILGVFQRVERFRTAIVGLHAEKSGLRTTLEEKHREVDKLKEEVDLFKDALAKSIAKRSGDDAKNRPRTSRTAHTTDECALMAVVKAVKGPDSDLQTQLEHAAQVNALEKERIWLEDTIAQLNADKEALARQTRELRQEMEHQAISAGASRSALEKALEQAARDAHEKMSAHRSRERELQNSLTAMTDKCRQDEEVAEKKKQSLRSDNQALEMRLRKVEDELRAKSALLGQKADTAATLKRINERVETLTVQLKATELKLVAVTREADGLRNERGRESVILTQTRRELEEAVSRIEELTKRLLEATAAQTSQQAQLRQAELKLTQAQAEVERQTSMTQHHAGQVQRLEAKLSLSISIDEDELKRRQQVEETAWHQKLTAVEHLLAVERQRVQSLKDQHESAIAAERERATHTASQAKTIAIELEAANLCLAERKKQRDREHAEFEHQRLQLMDRIGSLMKEVDHQKQQRSLLDHQELEQQLRRTQEGLTMAQRSVERKEEELRQEYARKQSEISERHQLEIERFRVAAENALAAELEVREQLETMEEERDLLLHRRQGVVSPRGGPSALSEARVELQKAKLKIAALEEKMNKGDSSRGKDVEGKLAQLALRERRLGDDQKALKRLKQDLSAEKKHLKATQDALETERAVVEADRAKNQEEHKLLRQIITALASRLALQMQLLGVIPPEFAASTGRQLVGSTTSSFADFVAKFQREQPDNWRKMQLKWEQLQQELDDSDWQLVHMRHRLEELNLDGVGVPAQRPKTPILSAFSDAVAAGRDTVPVVEQLQASASKAAMVSPPPPLVPKEDAVAIAARVRQEEQETFAIAMAKEMRAMKDSYEAKMEELQAELRRTQKLRVESTQRLRSELDDEKHRSQQIISQLSDKCATLEAQLLALQRAFTQLQDAQINALQAYDSAATDAERKHALQSLLRVVQDACTEERSRREALEKERVRKLMDYCGSSSVSVERDDKASVTRKL